MEIDYDKDFKKVMTELQTNFGWSKIEVLPDSYRDLLNDTIKAVKNCSIPEVSQQRELLIAYEKQRIPIATWYCSKEVYIKKIDQFLSNLKNCK